MPRLTDDLSTVTLDLHGATVDEAVRLARRALAVSAQRGRHRLDLVHGTSTSDPFGTRRTIKHALHAWLDAGQATHLYTSETRRDTDLSLYLDLTKRSVPARITLRDVTG